MRSFTNRFLFTNPLARKCVAIIETAFGASEARMLLAKNIECHSGAIIGWLDVLDVGYDVLHDDAAELPKTGAVLLIANHPSGVLDGLILLDFCLSVRSDVKILARGVFREFGDTGELIIPVPVGFDRDSWEEHLEAKRQAQDFLAAGGVVIVFGGSVVNRWHHGSFTEGPWSPFVAKLSVEPHVRVLPVFLGIHCSRLYKFVTFFSVAGQRILLLREILKKRGRRFPLVVGKVFTTGALEAQMPYGVLAESFRDRVLRLGLLLDRRQKGE